MANAPVLKTGVRKDLGVRIPRPPYSVHTAKRRAYPFDFPRSSPRWTEIAASGIATIALFAIAMVSMTSVSTTRFRSQIDASRTQTRITFLPPAAPLPPAPRPRERPVRPRASPQSAPAPQPQLAKPVAPTVPTTPPQTDTATAPTLPTVPPTNIITPNDRLEFRPSAGASGLGAPAAPAGLTERSRAARAGATMNSRDSALAAWAAVAHEAQRWSTMSDDMKKEIAQSRQEGVKLAQRVGTAGNSGDVHVVQGQGKDGVGSAGGAGTLGSFALPLFSRGRSREQRMRDSVIDAEIRAGLARSAAIIKARRDSIRADSIRADSLRKVAQVRKP